MSLIQSFLQLKQTRGVDEDSEECIDIHAAVVQNKPLLKRVYSEWYRQIVSVKETVEPLSGEILEIGSGGGFLKEFIPEAVTSDVYRRSDIDRIENAYHLSCRNNSVKLLCCVSVINQLGRVEEFFKEVERVLIPGGKLVIVDPYISWFSRLVYKYIHHYHFDLSSKSWNFPETGRMSGNDTTLATKIFWRDRDVFIQKFPTLKIQSIVLHNFVAYYASGGVSCRSLVPNFLVGFVMFFEKMVSPFMRYLACFQTVVLVKRETTCQ